MPLDETTIVELKLAQARLFQQLFATNSTWTIYESQYRALAELLKNRKRLQALARRHKNDPERFCEKVKGKNWFVPPTRLSKRQIQASFDHLPRLVEYIRCAGDTERLRRYWDNRDSVLPHLASGGDGDYLRTVLTGEHWDLNNGNPTLRLHHIAGDSFGLAE